MYAVKVEQGRERAEVRHISSGFLPSYRVSDGSPDRPYVRSLVVPGYVFTLVRVRLAIPVPDDEWRIIDKISDSKPSVMDSDGKFVSGPLMGLDQYVVQTGKDSVYLCVDLLGEKRRYRLPCQFAEAMAVTEENRKEVPGVAKTGARFTDEQKAAMLKRAGEIGVHAAAGEFGVAWQVIAQMKRRANEGADHEKKEPPAAKASAKKTGIGRKTGQAQVVMTTAPERPATELEIENAFLREQVEKLTAKVEKLKKALSDLL